MFTQAEKNLIQVEASGERLRSDLQEPDIENSELTVDIESSRTNVQLYRLTTSKSGLYIPPFADAVVKSITIATDLYSTHTSPVLIGIATCTQFLNSAGLNVKSAAENGIATANMVRFNVLPEEWPVLSRCKRIIAAIMVFPPTVAATISDASQTFFSMRTVGTYRYLKELPSLFWDVTGGLLAFATGWTTLFTKGLETGHAASSVLGKSEEYPNRGIQFTITTVGWVCGGGALIHETAITFTAMMTICASLSISTDEAKYPLLAVSLSNGVATACYQKAFMTNALQTSYRCIATNSFNRKKACMLGLSLGLSMLTLLEMQFNKITYRTSMNNFYIPDNTEDDWSDVGIKIIAGYVFASVYLVSAAALYDPVSQTLNWLGTKVCGGTYRLLCNTMDYISNVFWEALVPQHSPEREASLPLLADTDDEEEIPAEINPSASIQTDEATNSPLIAQSLFTLQRAKTRKSESENIMRCGLF